MSSADYVIREITAAFPTKRPRAFEPMVNSAQSEEPLATAAAFADKDDWTRLKSDWLDQAPDGWASALSFLSDEAICFYIPAYLIADLKGELEHVDPTFQLIRGFDARSLGKRIWPGRSETWTDYATTRWSHLTATQARAIVLYLEWRTAGGHDFDQKSIRDALDAFWNRRAAET